MRRRRRGPRDAWPTAGSLVVIAGGGKIALVGDLFRGGALAGYIHRSEPEEHFYQDDLAATHRRIHELLARGIEYFVMGRRAVVLPMSRACSVCDDLTPRDMNLPRTDVVAELEIELDLRRRRRDPEFSIVVPALNEELTIGTFVDWCKEWAPQRQARSARS